MSQSFDLFTKEQLNVLNKHVGHSMAQFLGDLLVLNVYNKSSFQNALDSSLGQEAIAEIMAVVFPTKKLRVVIKDYEALESILGKRAYGILQHLDALIAQKEITSRTEAICYLADAIMPSDFNKLLDLVDIIEK